MPQTAEYGICLAFIAVQCSVIFFGMQLTPILCIVTVLYVYARFTTDNTFMEVQTLQLKVLHTVRNIHRKLEYFAFSTEYFNS